MRVSVKEWGNSAAVRIPSAIMHSAHLELDQVVDIREENGRIIIEPIQKPEYALKELVSKINSDNLHTEFDSGKPVGNEIW